MASPPWVLHHLAHPRNTGSQDDAPRKASPEDKVAMPPQLVMLLSENSRQEGPQRVIGTSPSFSHPPSFGLGSSFSSCDPGQSDSTSCRRRPATWTRSSERGGRGGANPASCPLDLQPQLSWSEDHRPPALPGRFSAHHPLPREINYVMPQSVKSEIKWILNINNRL